MQRLVGILDRYIIGKFLKTFFFTALIFVLIGGIIDFSDKVEKFIESGITLTEIWLIYYPSFSLFLLTLLWPLFTLISVIFFTSRLAYNSEVISILNAGVSFGRFMRPYLLTAGFLTLVHFGFNHYLTPVANNARLDIEHKYIWTTNDKGKTSDVHLYLDPQTKIYVQRFRKQDSIANKFYLERYEDENLVYLLKAATAKWMGPPNNWRLKNYQIRTFDGDKETLVVEKKGTIDTTFNLTPADFVDYKEQQQMMTSAQLARYIRKQKERGSGNTRKYEIELYRRTADPVTIFILTIIGVAIASRKVRGGLGLNLAIGIGLGALYVFLSRFTSVFANGNALPILAGIWAPNVIFGLIAIFLVTRAQK